MISENNIKGAEWRKWDLHIHSDASDGKSTPTDIINEAKQKGLSVIALTDHHTAKNVDVIKKVGKEEGISVISGIEFRTEYGQKSVHLIGLFPEIHNGTELTAKALHDLILSPLNLSETQIISRGREIDPSFDNDKAFKEGMFLVQVDFKKTADLIHKYGGVVSVHAGTKANSFETEMKHVGSSVKNVKELYDSLGTVKEDLLKNGYIDICEIRNENDSADFYLKVFGKPSIIASDAHTKDLIGDKFTWIKADPNFSGLKQIINEPDERVFIGEKPEVLKRIDLNRTKYIKELSITKEDGYSGTNGIWFNNITVPLNSELVAIIGNKGSGKSAIADIVSLCSNYYDNNDFSFLSNKKFREKNGKIAKNFTATIVWQSGQKNSRNLNDTPDSSEVKNVKYIPQGQFEKLTNEISSATEFQKEIEKVVFSHIDDAEKLGAQSFDELVEKKTKTVEVEQETLYGKIKSVNEEIIKLENKETKTYSDEVGKKLEKKEEELKSLIEPPIVENPNDDPIKKQQSLEVNNTIEKLKKKIDILSRLKKIKDSGKKSRLIKLKNLKDTKSEIELKIEEFNNFLQTKSEILFDINLDVDSVVKVNYDFSKLNEVISTQENQLENIKISLGEIQKQEGESSIPKLIEEENAKLVAETKKLDDEQNKYQSYLTAKKIWKDSCNKITGDKNTTNTIEFYKAEIEYLNSQLAIDLDLKYKERKETVRKIFKNKQSVIEVYKEVKDKLSQIISENSDTLKNYKIEVDASLIKKSDFNNRFLSNIQQNKAGTYFSKEGAEKQLSDIVTDVDFDNEDSIIDFLDSIIKSLKTDIRIGNTGIKRELNDQVKDILALYNYLFNLEFLDYKYQLKQGSKEIDQLSPGERGALLLVFYLLLDKNDIPLIIDQPEDNLDNESVAAILVPFIRAAKKKRQIILVTHNPNLAVVADAEQVIYVDLDKENNYTFSLVSGSIENTIVNDKIVKVLEGAMPAFKKRKQKYYDN